ncbi:MAG: replication initiation negative regulator SeqA [Psychrobium sp.]|nr:replication initiation negative regulator SeqA [Psychrobium sp.]
MKTIEVEDDLYRYIASQTEDIGESASAILRRLLGLPAIGEINVEPPLKSPAVVRADAKSAPTERKKATKVVIAPRSDFSVLITPTKIKEQKAAVGRFLFLLERLQTIAPQDFSKVLEISGRDRIYFAIDQQTLLDNNASTKPKQIGQSSYWVMTNSNTVKKRSMLKSVLTALGCNLATAERIAGQI